MKYGRLRISGIYLCVLLLLCGESCTGPSSLKAGDDWPRYGGNDAGNRFSPLTQINVGNVKQLEVAWKYDAVDSDEVEHQRQIECQPIVVRGVLYATTPKLKLFALDAATGKPLWKFDPSAVMHGYNSSNRGLNYWEDGSDKRILYAAGSSLYAVNALTGDPVQTFGDHGVVDLHTGLESATYDANKYAITATSPGVIYKDILIIGSTVSEQGDALPGSIRGFDVRSGKLKWIFHTIPRPGEPGYDTWPKDAYKTVGGVNCWGGMVLDGKRGMVYLGTGSPSPNFYGGNRPGKNLFANCVLALDAETGELKWYYQTVHHDLWDWDLPCPPNLVTVMRDGKKVDAVVQTTKDGLVYVLDRDSGASLFPVREQPVPMDALPGEHAWPTQKFPEKPAPLTRQVYTQADLPDSSLFPEAYAYIQGIFLKSKHGQKFEPPSIEGTLGFGISGGAEWGGSAVSPDGILYQNVSEMPWVVQLTDLNTWIKKSTSRGNSLYITHCAACHGVDRKGSKGQFPSLVNIGQTLSADQIDSLLRSGRGRMPSFQQLPEYTRQSIIGFLLHVGKVDKKSGVRDSSELERDTASFPYQPPYVGGGHMLKDKEGYPGIRPPWGTLNAVDLNTGEYVWKVPLGEYPKLSGKRMPPTGSENSGGPLVTAGGLVFIAGTEDEKIRAFEEATGKVVWEYQLPAGAFATPITYSVKGRQYIAIAVGGVRGGHKKGGWYMAFALPDKAK
jgi:quinoprotein glucose dehydrogenase